ncbi:hypothetical protein XENTR_v10004023 [Xenopus tropicalis]|nr:hypothetical protein XENTR_v10004023 [Xenopus tropicalis]
MIPPPPSAADQPVIVLANWSLGESPPPNPIETHRAGRARGISRFSGKDSPSFAMVPTAIPGNVCNTERGAWASDPCACLVPTQLEADL